MQALERYRQQCALPARFPPFLGTPSSGVLGVPPVLFAFVDEAYNLEGERKHLNGAARWLTGRHLGHTSLSLSLHLSDVVGCLA